MKTRYKILLIAVPAAAVLTVGITAGVLAAPRWAPVDSAGVRAAGAAGLTSVARPTDADYAAWGCPFFASIWTAMRRFGRAEAGSRVSASRYRRSVCSAERPSSPFVE